MSCLKTDVRILLLRPVTIRVTRPIVAKSSVRRVSTKARPPPDFPVPVWLWKHVPRINRFLFASCGKNESSEKSQKKLIKNDLHTPALTPLRVTYFRNANVERGGKLPRHHHNEKFEKIVFQLLYHNSCQLNLNSIKTNFIICTQKFPGYPGTHKRKSTFPREIFGYKI